MKSASHLLTQVERTPDGSLNLNRRIPLSDDERQGPGDDHAGCLVPLLVPLVALAAIAWFLNR